MIKKNEGINFWDVKKISIIAYEHDLNTYKALFGAKIFFGCGLVTIVYPLISSACLVVPIYCYFLSFVGYYLAYISAKEYYEEYIKPYEI